MKIVNFRAPIKEIGGSLYIPIRMDIRKELYLEEPKLITDGLMISGKIWVVETKEVKCPKCKHVIETYSDEDPHDCPNCDNEFTDADVLENDK